MRESGNSVGTRCRINWYPPACIYPTSANRLSTAGTIQLDHSFPGERVPGGKKEEKLRAGGQIKVGWLVVEKRKAGSFRGKAMGAFR